MNSIIQVSYLTECWASFYQSLISNEANEDANISENTTPPRPKVDIFSQFKLNKLRYKNSDTLDNSLYSHERLASDLYNYPGDHPPLSLIIYT